MEHTFASATISVEMLLRGLKSLPPSWPH